MDHIHVFVIDRIAGADHEDLLTCGVIELRQVLGILADRHHGLDGVFDLNRLEGRCDRNGTIAGNQPDCALGGREDVLPERFDDGILLGLRHLFPRLFKLLYLKQQALQKTLAELFTGLIADVGRAHVEVVFYVSCFGHF